MLQRGVAPAEVAYQGLMELMYHVAIHKRGGGSGHGVWMWLVVPYFPREENPKPVDDWEAINIGSIVNYGASQVAIRLVRRVFQEDPHIWGQEGKYFF